MNFVSRASAALVVVSLAGVVACEKANPLSPEGTEGAEHGPEGQGGEAGESGVQLGLNDTFDETQSGARLILRYDGSVSAFVGTVENTTTGTLRRVRVEVHLSNGVELGPTTPTDLRPGRVMKITLSAAGQTFTTWSAHPEVG